MQCLSIARHPVYRLKRDPRPARAPRTPESRAQMRKLVYHATASVDGFVLDSVHDKERFIRGAIEQHRAIESKGVALMGRGTYLALRSHMAKAGYDMAAFVFSREWRTQDDNVEWIADDAQEWARRMKTCPGKDFHFLGGRRLAHGFFRTGLVDEVVVRVAPVLQGTGERALPEIRHSFELVAGASVAYDDGSVALTYRLTPDQAEVPEGGCEAPPVLKAVNARS